MKLYAHFDQTGYLVVDNFMKLKNANSEENELLSFNPENNISYCFFTLCKFSKKKYFRNFERLTEFSSKTNTFFGTFFPSIFFVSKKIQFL